MSSKIVVAVDFDGTLSISDFPGQGQPNRVLFKELMDVRDEIILILWTCRVGIALTDAVAWCKEHGLEFDAVNENCQQSIEQYTDCRKILADVYIDDRALRPGLDGASGLLITGIK